MLLSASLLAQAREGGIGAGTLSFLIIVLMGVATALLVRNMNGRLKNLPSTFDPPQSAEAKDRADALPAGVDAEGRPGPAQSG